MQSFFDWCSHQSLASWVWFSLLGNLLAAGGSVLGCWGLSRWFQRRRILERPQPLTAADVLFSLGAVVLNAGVAIAGWILWKLGWISITNPSLGRIVGDTFLLIVVMDFAMYVLHRLAHHRWLFRWMHALHHTHESTNPLSLFVLNPFEVLGFGSLLLVVLMLLPFSGAAILIYLSINLAFGTIGHLGVEPLPRSLMRWVSLRYVGTSTFHALHHAEKTYNFGFYTTIWDRLFRTLHPGYDGRWAH